MRVLATDGIRRLDERMIVSSCPEGRLMGRAVRGLARIWLDWAGPAPLRVLVCAGPGNNGGDGFGFALHLHGAGHRVRVRVAAREERIRGDARRFLDEALKAGVPVTFAPETSQWDADAADSPCADWMVDALLGSGSGGAPRGVLAAAVNFMKSHRSHCRILAVDLPSGFDAEKGKPFDADVCVRADYTLSLGAVPPGFLEAESAAFCGSVTGVDLGFALGDLEDYAVRREEIMDPATARRLFPFRRDADTHKGNFGHVRIWGGSEGMLGAAVLAGRAALISGAGRVTLHVPEAAAASVNAANPELMVRTDMRELENASVVLMGPGLAVNDASRQAFRELTQRLDGPLVLDAGALRLLAEEPGLLLHRPAPVWITPHPGEAAALMDCSVAEVQEDRAMACTFLQKLTGAHVILKGHRSRIRCRSGREWINLNGNAMLATAGSGDVLAGLLAAMVARALPEDEAAALAVHLHAAAADRLFARSRSGRATALDILGEI